MTALTGALVLAAVVLPLKPPLSDAARCHPGPTVIRAGALRPTDRRAERVLARQTGERCRMMLAEIEAAKRQAVQMADRMERTTAADLLRGRDVLREMKAAGFSPQRIAEFRRELETSAAEVRAEGRRIREELKAAGMEAPSP